MISCHHSILFRFRNDWVNRMARAGALGELCVSMPLALCFKRVIPVGLSCTGLQRAHETRQIIRQNGAINGIMYASFPCFYGIIQA